MKSMWRRIKWFFGIGRKHFVWFDTERLVSVEIDKRITGPDGRPYPPIDCVMAVVGNRVDVYESYSRGSRHVCVAGREAHGNRCAEDFDTDNYRLIDVLKVSKPNTSREAR